MPMAVELLRRLVVSTREHQVVWIATNGREAVEACRRDLPDLILMDLAMPEMDGVEATGRIMAETPCSILLVTASIEANVAGVYEAMGHGALDAVDIPSVGIEGNVSSQSARLLTNKIATIGKLVRDAPSKTNGRMSVAADPSPRRLVAIGASAGGPAAVAAVLSAFPIDFGGRNRARPASRCPVHPRPYRLAGGNIPRFRSARRGKRIGPKRGPFLLPVLTIIWFSSRPSNLAIRPAPGTMSIGRLSMCFSKARRNGGRAH